MHLHIITHSHGHFWKAQIHYVTQQTGVSDQKALLSAVTLELKQSEDATVSCLESRKPGCLRLFSSLLPVNGAHIYCPAASLKQGPTLREFMAG